MLKELVMLLALTVFVDVTIAEPVGAYDVVEPLAA